MSGADRQASRVIPSPHAPPGAASIVLNFVSGEQLQAVGVAPALILAAFSSLAWLSHAPPVAAWQFLLCFVIAWLAFGWLNTAEPTRATLAVGVISALAVRLAGLSAVPIYEDDWARYLWDGFRFLQDGTPYGYAPAAYVDDASLDQTWTSILSQVNNPTVPTIYAPTLQYVFALAAWIAPASLTALKALLIAADLAIWALIARLGGAVAGLRYALCPLVIFEVSFNAHADIIGVALMISCYALVRSSRFIESGVVFGLALASKPFAIVVAPTFLLKRWPLIAFGATAALALLYLPFVIEGATELEGLQIFSRWWEFNSFGFAGLKAIFGDPSARPIGFVVGAALAATLGLHWRVTQPQTVPPADHWLLALLLFAPVINAWYLLWVVPWVCLRPNALTWSILPAISLSYLTVGVLGHTGAGFHDHPDWARPLEFGVAVAIYVALTIGQRPRSCAS
jgi:alpha-1,6-mannosyltransferase